MRFSDKTLTMQQPVSPYNHALLAASLAVHRLLLSEQDLPKLLQGACDQLVKDALNRAAMLVLLDNEVGSVITAEAGLGSRFNRVMDQLRNSELPDCGRQCLAREDEAAILCDHCNCGVCGNGQKEKSTAVAVAIRCRPGLVGFLVVELLPSSEIGQADLDLYQEMAHSISQALGRLFAVEEARQRELELKRVEERFELALYASRAGLWDWNIKTGEMYTSPDRREFLNYMDGDDDPGVSPLQGLIHPDDQKRVMDVLNDHLAGKTDEYRIEYRIKDRQGNWKWFLDRGRVVERDEKNMPVRMTGTHQDITRQKNQDETLAAVQKQLHEAVHHERNFLQTVIDGAADPVMAIDIDYNILLMNRVAAKLLHVDPELASLAGEKCYQFFFDRDQPCTNSFYPCPVQEVRQINRPVTLIHETYHGNGVSNIFEIEASPLRDKEGNIYGAIEVARNITDRLRTEKKLRESQSRLYHLAHHDSLTGLPNRLLFEDRLEQAILKARRTGARLAILFLDLDKFKHINDTLGHDVGDGLLIAVAKRLQNQCRQSDTMARLGGDEFVFILDNLRDRSGAEVVARKILSALSRPVLVNEHELQVSTSIGIAVYPDDSEDIEGVIKYADIALYQAKEDGRDTYRLYSPEMEQAVDSSRSLGTREN
jgi:diguanylate cyclase (GGDEF)-like protein/PAS domain S-box-containing protein